MEEHPGTPEQEMESKPAEEDSNAGEKYDGGEVPAPPPDFESDAARQERQDREQRERSEQQQEERNRETQEQHKQAMNTDPAAAPLDPAASVEPGQTGPADASADENV